VAAWRAARCLIGHYVCPTGLAYGDYCGWCADADLEPVSRSKFMAALRRLGHVTVPGATSFRVGITLRPPPDPDPELTAAVALVRRCMVGRSGWRRAGELRPVAVWRDESGYCARCEWPAHTRGGDGRWWHALCWQQRRVPVPNPSYERWSQRRVVAEGSLCCASCAKLLRNRWGAAA